MDDIAIKVEHVSKTFKLPHDRSSSLKGKLINRIKRRHGYELQHALEDINFEVKKGEFFGIVGKNGGGKSTLLKVISGIYTPSKGGVQTNGKLTPFIELGVGFNPELTGRENVFLNGSLLGFSRKEMQGMYNDIVEFSEIERFMDQKLKNYSSGMQVRLAFSIAIQAQSDILVMDEVLAVGDSAFQKKCFEVFRELKKQKRTIILVTHDMANVEKFCDRVLVVDKGKQLIVTNPSEASTLYARLNVKERTQKSQKETPNNRYGTGEIRVESVELYSKTGKTDIHAMGEDLSFRIRIKRQKGHELTPVACGLAFYNEDNVNVIGPNSEKSKIDATTSEIICMLPKLSLTPGEYKVTIALYNKDKFTDYYDFLDRWVKFSVIADHATHGVVELENEWGPRKEPT